MRAGPQGAEGPAAGVPAPTAPAASGKTLDLRGQGLEKVPAYVFDMRDIEQLDLSDNRLAGLPLELANPKALRRLDLRGNDVSRQDLDAIRAGLRNAEILE